MRGELVTVPVEDWSFTRDYFEIQVETRGRWLPHSVTTICMAVGSRLYVPARRGGVKTWVANLMSDPRARIRIGGKVYERKAVRVMGGEELGPAALALLINPSVSFSAILVLLGWGSLRCCQEKLGSKLGSNLAATLSNTLIHLTFSIRPKPLRA